MIEQQTIGGRPATIAYMSADFIPADLHDFALAKIIFDDGEIVFLVGPSDGEHEAGGFGRHRQKHRAPMVAPPIDPGEQEMAAFSRHRGRPFLLVAPDIELPEPFESEPDVTAVEPPVKLQLVAWSKAILVLDKSEVLVRDMIERELMGKTGDAANYRPLRSIVATKTLALKIKNIRDEAFKTAFRLLRARLGNIPVLTVSLAAWAAYFAREDHRTILATMQTALADGLDATEIARKVVGSMALNGVDGVTEYTRHKIAHLGRAAIRSSNLRKQGLDDDGEALRRLKGLDPGG